MTIREGAWDCPSCGRQRNRGPARHCAGCGFPRGTQVPLYLPEDAAEVTDAAELARAHSGPDWTCGYCDGDNRSGEDFCGGCGASADGAPPRAVREIREANPAPPPPAAPPARRKGCLAALGGLGAVILLLILGGIGAAVWWMWPSDTSLTVVGHEWKRTIQVEALRTVQEQAWEGELPADARIRSQERAVHHTNRVQTGTRPVTRTVSERQQVGMERVKVGVRDLGNGYFEDIYENRPVYRNVERQETVHEPVYREDPVYRTRYTYEVDRWQEDRVEEASGQDHQARWPEPRLSRNERLADRAERYVILFQNEKGKSFRHELADAQRWSAFPVGLRCPARVRESTGAVLDVQPGPERRN